MASLARVIVVEEFRVSRPSLGSVKAEHEGAKAEEVCDGLEMFISCRFLMSAC